MKYFLGIDGGGSKTEINVIDENNNIIFSSIYGPSSIDTVDINTTYLNTINEINKLNYTYSSVHFGVGGVYTSKDIIMLVDMLKDIKNRTKDCVLSASNDIDNLYSSAFDNKYGICIISGTGSVVYGKKNNNSFRVGGYGYKEGDSGSGYSIGLEALQLTARVIDKRISSSKLANKVLKYLNVNNYASLGDYVSHCNRTDIASIAKIVLENYEFRDSKRIINKNINELVKMIKACAKELNFDDSFDFSIGGGIGLNPIFNELLLNKIKSIYPNSNYVTLKNSCAYGASLIAKHNYIINKEE